MDIREIGWRCVQYTQFAQDRGRWWVLVNTAMILRVLAPRSWLVREIIAAYSENHTKLIQSTLCTK
jgi:hypothetical protein